MWYVHAVSMGVGHACLQGGYTNNIGKVVCSLTCMLSHVTWHHEPFISGPHPLLYTHQSCCDGHGAHAQRRLDPPAVWYWPAQPSRAEASDAHTDEQNHDHDHCVVMIIYHPVGSTLFSGTRKRESTLLPNGIGHMSCIVCTYMCTRTGLSVHSG